MSTGVATKDKSHFIVSDEELNGLLHRYTRDITEQNRQGKFDPITGRDNEIDHMTLILLQRLRKNIMLLAAPASVKPRFSSALPNGSRKTKCRRC